MIDSNPFIHVAFPKSDTVNAYIDELKTKAGIEIEVVEEEEVIVEPTAAEAASSSTDDLPQYESGEDYDKATTYKMEAADLKSSGDYANALSKYNLAIQAAPPSALLLANRGDTLYRLDRYSDAVTDCDSALEKNPDR